jgi:hypothetical protein
MGLDQRSGALWMTELETGLRERLFPRFDLMAYDVSRDGRRIVFAALDDKGRSHLWLARLDTRLAPRQLSPVEADSPRFGAHDDIFFRMQDGPARFIFRMAEDGSDLHKAVDQSILFFMSSSPDGAWLVARVASSGPKVVAFPTRGGAQVPVCADCEADWTPGGESFVVREFRPSLTIALPAQQTLPRLPAGGLRSDADAAGSSVASAADGFRYPGPDTSQYAYVKAPIQRNIYRVPLP